MQRATNQRSAWKSCILATPVVAILISGAVSSADAPMVPASGITARPQMVHNATVQKIATASRETTYAAPQASASPAAAPSLLPVVDQKDIHPEHRVLADGVLRALPAHCRNHLRNLYVLYDPTNTRRGLGGASTILVTGLVPALEFQALLIHECGHVTDLGALRGSEGAAPTPFVDGSTIMVADDPSVTFYKISWVTATKRAPGSRQTDFVSGYAATDAYEDFAEHFAFYALHREEFARQASDNPILAQKYSFMRDFVFGPSSDIAEGQFTRTASAPWDVTRLAYTWN